MCDSSAYKSLRLVRFLGLDFFVYVMGVTMFENCNNWIMFS